jgi:hypothetical protein
MKRQKLYATSPSADMGNQMCCVGKGRHQGNLQYEVHTIWKKRSKRDFEVKALQHPPVLELGKPFGV